MRKLPLLIFVVLCLSTVMTSYSSYIETKEHVRANLDIALQKTIAIKGAEAMRRDSISAYNALVNNSMESVSITTSDKILRQHLKINQLKDRAYLAYDISPENGKLYVKFRSEVSCSKTMIFCLSDQRLSMLLCFMSLLSLCFSIKIFNKNRNTHFGNFGGLWFDNSCGRFKTTDNVTLHLTPMQQELMEMFFNSENHTITKQNICDRLWPKKPDASDTLYTLIRRLKPIIENQSNLKIESDRGRSYKLKINNVD